MPQTDPSADFTQARKQGFRAEPIARLDVDLVDNYNPSAGNKPFSTVANITTQRNILNLGSISRSVEWDTLKFSPGSNTSEFNNTDGAWSDSKAGSLTNSGEYYGKNARISIGFKTASGLEYLPMYQGSITKKSENIKAKTVSLFTHDIFKKLKERTIAPSLNASFVWDYETNTSPDENLYQAHIGFGKHDFPDYIFDQNNKREDPFNISVCRLPLDGTTIGGAGGARIPNQIAMAYKNFGDLWWCPIQNEVDTIDADADVYFWDYLLERWGLLGGAGQRAIITGVNKYFYVDFSASNTQSIAAGGSVNWDDYIAGTGAYSGATNVDPAVAIRFTTDSSLTIAAKTAPNLNNPVTQIAYLLGSTHLWENERFSDTTDTGQLDQKDFTSPDLTYSFDQAYDIMDDAGAKLITNFRKTTPVLQVIEKIAQASGISFYSTQPESINADLTNNFDKRIKCSADVPVVSPGACTVFAPIAMTLDTKRNIFDAIIESDMTRLKNKITLNYVDFSTMRKDEDIQTIIREDSDSQEEVGEIAFDVDSSLRDGSIPYDRTFARFVANIYLNRLSIPEVIATVQADLEAMVLFIKKDIVRLVDGFTDLDDIFQPKKTSINFNNGEVSLELSRYGTLLGPDPKNPYKKWAFVDCAYVDNDAAFGSGTDADITINTTTVTLGSGETIDVNVVKAGMAVRIGDDGGTPHYARVASVTSTTTFELDTASPATVTNQQWSIGNSYHVF